jgi:hypothetical protein
MLARRIGTGAPPAWQVWRFGLLVAWLCLSSASHSHDGPSGDACPSSEQRGRGDATVTDGEHVQLERAQRDERVILELEKQKKAAAEEAAHGFPSAAAADEHREGRKLVGLSAKSAYR